MKKAILIIVNVCIILSIFAFVVIYSYVEHKNEYNNRVASFDNMTVTMERITDNYLQGEQSICDVWAHYINSRNMTLQEATTFIRSSHVSPLASAHLIDPDTLSGLSTRSNVSSPDKYDVSYKNVDILGDMEWITEVGQGNNVSRVFTNPMNGEQSLAFINWIKVVDENSGEEKRALLLRTVPVFELEDKWVFPQTEFKDAELSVINGQGDYIIKSKSYKSNNFFEFYKSYNETSNASLQELKNAISTGTGNLTMNDSKGVTCVIAYAPVSTSNDWVILNYIPNDVLSTESENWIMIGVIAAGLLLLLAVNIAYMQFLNRRLKQLAANAESANKAKTDFLSTMSHDIRTPMNAIIGLTTITEKKIDDQKTVRDNLRKISLASKHLLTLINDILDISKIESGKITLNPMTFSIADSVDNLVNISQPMIKEKNIDFNIRINCIENEYLYADQMRLNQIYINILSNAVKYTPSGGSVSVDLKQEDSHKPGYIRLVYKVADTGMGMSKEYMSVMYEPFTRQTDSRVNSIQGTGLGLTIVKKLIDLMDGTIDCQSEIGKGTTFTICLDIPIADKQPNEMKLKPIDVLIVDDDIDLLETAGATLESLGAHAEKADSGSKAIELVKDRQAKGKMFEIIIVDWKMPGMDGIETAQKMRSEIGEKAPILLISSYDWADVESYAIDAGIDGFISKPLFKSTLYSKISEIVSSDKESIEVEDDYSDIAGMNVLIAEDNDINWEIIHSLLEMHGVESERAENGRICVEKLKSAPEGTYDLIFMDIQMPEMNGLDATRTIRQLDNDKISNTPIIAMTADAFSENVAECLNAGMNGHIAKPVDISLVIKEIRKIKENRKS